MASFLDKATDIVKKAVDADYQENFEDAFNLYKNALDYFSMALKYERNANLQSLIRTKMEEYLSRAEKLKVHLQQIDEQKKKGANNAGGGMAQSKKGQHGGDDEAEQKKLREGLSQAILQEKPSVSWDDVAGLDSAKDALKEAVIFPIRFPQLFTGKRQPWRGILLYGPPGTGKSYLAKAVATEAESTFYSISSSDLVSKWMGESERLVKQLFQMARETKPSIIFIDEIDSLAGTRGEGETEASRRIKTEFLVQMNGVGNEMDGILILGATNIPWALDSAIKRRFEKRIFIPLPDFEARKRMFKLNIGSTPNTLSPDDFNRLSDLTDNYSGSDIAVVVRDALMQPIRKVASATHFKKVRVPQEDGRLVIKLLPCSPGDEGAIEKSWTEVTKDELLEPYLTYNDFYISIKSIKPSVDLNDLTKYRDFANEVGSE